MFAGSATGVYLTTNNGNNWISKNNGLLVTHTLSILISGNYLFAGTIGGIFKSTDNGESWSPVLLNRSIKALTDHYGTLYAGTEGYGVYISSNNGSNWIQANNGISDLNIKCLSNHSHVFAGTASGIFYTPSGGAIWGTYNYNLVNPNITALSGIPTTMLYAGTLTAGIYRFMGVSSGWQQLNNGLNTLSIRSFKITNSVIFTGTNNSVCMSTNYGENWIVKNEGFGTSGYAVNVLEIYHGYLFAGTANQSVWRRDFSEITDINSVNNNIPELFKLYQNFPNPFNPVTKIRFEVSASASLSNSDVRLIVYNSLGQEVATLVHAELKAGTYEVDWNGNDYPSGVYYYQLIAGGNIETKKMVLIK
jgi:hypothetical protein